MATPSNNTFDPASIGATRMNDGFDPSSIGAVPMQKNNIGGASTAPTLAEGVLPPLRALGEGAVNFVNNNPITRGIVSLAALPTQLAVKGVNALTGSHTPDPYAGGIGGGPDTPFNPVGVTSSDQPAGKFAGETLGNAGTVASLFAPVGEIAGATGKAAQVLAPKFLSGPAAFLGRIGVQGLFGMGVGMAGALQNGKTTPEELRSAGGTGGLIGSGLGIAGELGSALLDNAQTSGESRLEGHVKSGGAAKTLTRAFNDASTQTTNPIQTMEQNGLIKDLQVVDGKINVENLTNPQRTGSIDSMIQDQQEMGTQAVKTMKGGIPTADFKEEVLNTIKNSPALKASGNVGKMTAEVERRFADYAESYGETIPYEDVNSIRVQMNKNYDPETWDVEKAIGNSARKILYSGADDTGIQAGASKALQSAMASEQELINAKEFVNKLSGTAVKGGRLGKYIAEATGATVGALIGLPFGPVGSGIGATAGGMTTEKAMNLYQNSYFNPMLSQTAERAKAIIGSPAATAIGRAGRTILINNGSK